MGIMDDAATLSFASSIILSSNQSTCMSSLINSPVADAYTRKSTANRNKTYNISAQCSSSLSEP